MATHQIIQVETPFGMPAIRVPDFRNGPDFSIADFGAVPGDQLRTTRAIEEAIGQASARRGGRVLIPPGEWRTGKIHLQSNVNLHLEKDAVLLFSGDPQDYLPPVPTSWEGLECYNYSPLIYAYQCENIAISGEGTLKAVMDVWETWFDRPEEHLQSLKRLWYLAAEGSPLDERQMVDGKANLRPHFIQFNRCRHILVEGISIVNSPFWTLHPYLCEEVVIRKIRVFAHGHNNDGVDPDMCRNLLIEDCVFDQGDDAIAIKSGRNQGAWRLNTPSKNIVLRNCTIVNGHQLVAIGSELSGGIENVFIDNCQVLEGAKLYHLLNIKTNERRGGYVRNIHINNVRAGNIERGILGIATDILYQWRHLVPTLEKRLTAISDIYLSDIRAGEVRFVSKIAGQAELPVAAVHMKHVTADRVLEQAHQNENVTGFRED